MGRGRSSSIDAQQKMELILRMLRGETTVVALAKEVGVSEPTLYKWRDTFIQAGMSALSGDSKAKSQQQALQRELAQRDQVIGELTVANRVLKKTLGV